MLQNESFSCIILLCLFYCLDEPHTLRGIPTGLAGGSKRRRVGGAAASGTLRRVATQQAQATAVPVKFKKFAIRWEMTPVLLTLFCEENNFLSIPPE